MNAKEMFEKLGYSLKVDNNNLIEYSKEDCGHISFCFDIETKRFYSMYSFPSSIQSTPHSITLDEFEAVQKQMEELGWVEEETQEIKKETNFEHYYDALLKVGCSTFGVIDGKIKNCNCMACNKCEIHALDEKEYCRINVIKWLASPYKKPTYKLSKFEYDLVQTYSDCMDECKFGDFMQLNKLKNMGYFNCIDNSIKISDILGNCEIIDDKIQ